MKKVKVYHFHNCSGGGVMSVIRNILLYRVSDEIENHVIYTLNKETVREFALPQLSNAVSQRVFYYSPKWNFYYTCQQLAKLVPDDKAFVVAHDWLELGMVSNLGMKNPVLLFLHGNYDYYFQLAEKHFNIIDNFVCISKPIYERLIKIIPQKIDDISIKYFPVPEVKNFSKKNNILKLYYGVRSLKDKRKQFLLLPKIDKLLKEAGITVEWTVIGQGKDELHIKQGLVSLQNLTYYPQLENEKILEQLCRHDIFILPSYNEGLPVALVEAMKAGLVPLISDWYGATKEFVLEKENGFYIPVGDAKGYATTILQLNDDRKLLQQMSEKAIENANQFFDPYRNAKAIEDVLLGLRRTEKKIVKPEKCYGSRLDHPLIPNFVTRSIRSFSDKNSNWIS